MINHFKAEFYKLFRSKIMIAILGVCVALVMVSFALGDMTFFGAGDGTESVIGFQAKCYLSNLSNCCPLIPCIHSLFLDCLPCICDHIFYKRI